MILYLLISKYKINSVHIMISSTIKESEELILVEKIEDLDSDTPVSDEPPLNIPVAENLEENPIESVELNIHVVENLEENPRENVSPSTSECTCTECNGGGCSECTKSDVPEAISNVLNEFREQLNSDTASIVESALMRFFVKPWTAVKVTPLQFSQNMSKEFKVAFPNTVLDWERINTVFVDICNYKMKRKLLVFNKRGCNHHCIFMSKMKKIAKFGKKTNQPDLMNFANTTLDTFKNSWDY
jgi:hypothetical protein